MPSLNRVVARFTKQTLVYWQKTGSDGFGKPVFAPPTEVKCRWEDRQQEILLSDGRTVVTKAYLLLASPLEAGSIVFLGTLANWQAMITYPAIPSTGQGGIEVLMVNTTPDFKAKSFVYEAYL